MDKYTIGILLMLRPFEVWIASYTLLQVLERKEVSEALNYIFLGINAFATLIMGYMVFFAKRTDLNGVWVNLVASVSVIWVLWIFVGLYKTISNNRRGVTISLARTKVMDRILLWVVVPVAFLFAARMLSSTLILKEGSLMDNPRNIFGLLVGIILILIVLIYLISTVKRFERYVVFGSKTIEVWKKDRGKVFKYSQVAQMEPAATSILNKNRYKVVFLKDEDKETIYPDDSRMEYVKKELDRVIREKEERVPSDGRTQTNTLNRQNGANRTATASQGKQRSTSATATSAQGKQRPAATGKPADINKYTSDVTKANSTAKPNVTKANNANAAKPNVTKANNANAAKPNVTKANNANAAKPNGTKANNANAAKPNGTKSNNANANRTNSESKTSGAKKTTSSANGQKKNSKGNK